jgi:hypothetical protein
LEAIWDYVLQMNDIERYITPGGGDSWSMLLQRRSIQDDAGSMKPEDRELLSLSTVAGELATAWCMGAASTSNPAA